MVEAMLRRAIGTAMRAGAIVVMAAAIGAARVALADPGVTDPAEAFERFGLLGTWSPDCSLPPSRLNPRVTWRVADGVVVHTVTFDGRMVAVRDLVTSADILGGHDMQVAEARGDGTTLTVVVRLIGDNAWAVRSVGPDGHVFVDESTETATGKPALVDERCEAATS